MMYRSNLNWIAKLVIAKLDWWATCVDVLEQPDSLIQDATELSQITESGEPISKDEFLTLVDLLPDHQKLIEQPDVTFAVDSSGQLAWFYDPKADIHYFYS